MSRDIVAEALDLAARLGGGRPVVRRELADVAAAGMEAFVDGVVLVAASAEDAWRVGPDGVMVVVPSTAADAKGLLLAAAFDDGPVLYVEPEWLPPGDPPDGDWRVPLRTAVVRRSGRDVTVLGFGSLVHGCLAAAEAASGPRGFEVEVVDLRTLAPLDEETVLASVGRTRNLVVVHEDGAGRGGLAAEVVARVQEELFAELERPILRATLATLAAALHRLTT